MRLNDAAEWLRGILADGPRPSREVVTASKVAGIGKQTLKAARWRLGVKSYRRVACGQFYMTMGEVEDGGKEMELPPLVRTDKDIASALALEWYEGHRGESSPGLMAQVEWVAERLLLPMSCLRKDDVICGSAVSLLLWARSGNEDTFRQLYHAKLIERPVTRVVDKKKVAKGGQDAIDRLLGKG